MTFMKEYSIHVRGLAQGFYKAKITVWSPYIWQHIPILSITLKMSGIAQLLSILCKMVPYITGSSSITDVCNILYKTK